MGDVMLIIARCFGLSLITWLVAMILIHALKKLIIVGIVAVSLLTGVAFFSPLLVLAMFNPASNSADISACIFLGVVGMPVGMVVGAIAGAAREIVAIQTRKTPIRCDADF